MPDRGRLQRRLARAVEAGVAPAMVLLLWQKGRLLLCLAAGQARQDTVFDLASLSKPLATAPLILDLICAGRLDWQTTLAQIYGPAVPEDKRGITIAMLLRHSAGFPAHRPYYLALAGVPPAARRGLLKAMLLNEPLAASPGSRTLYSDLGYLLLGLLAEETGGLALPPALAALYAKLGVSGPRYLPLERPLPWPLGRIAPCGPLDGRPQVHGQVEDENAFALGGAAGHAGLFGTADQVAAVMDALCRAAAGGKPWPAQQASLLFTPDPDLTGSDRTAGFDLPSGAQSAAGLHPPAGLVGHNGFTGTSLWWHPGHNSGVVLLSNRVALGRDNQLIKSFRHQLHGELWPLLLENA